MIIRKIPFVFPNSFHFDIYILFFASQNGIWANAKKKKSTLAFIRVYLQKSYMQTQNTVKYKDETAVNVWSIF